MASKKRTNTNLTNTFEVVKEKAGSLNKEVIATADAFVESSVDSIKQWQDILGKALNNGTELIEQQQNIAIDALESTVNQTKNGGVRIKNLFDFNINFKNIWKKNKPDISLNKVKDTAIKTFNQAKDTIDEVVELSSKESKKATKRVKKANTKAKKTTKK